MGEMRACDPVLKLFGGNRVDAAKQFQNGIDTRVFDYWDWEWSRMFLDKLNQDPAWPPWIPLREEAAAVKDNGDG